MFLFKCNVLLVLKCIKMSVLLYICVRTETTSCCYSLTMETRESLDLIERAIPMDSNYVMCKPIHVHFKMPKISYVNFVFSGG